jgi:hypothetical protein
VTAIVTEAEAYLKLSPVRRDFYDWATTVSVHRQVGIGRLVEDLATAGRLTDAHLVWIKGCCSR